MKSFIIASLLLGLLVSPAFAAEKKSAGAGNEPRMSQAEFAKEIQRMLTVIRANDDISTPGTEFRPGAVPPDYFKGGATSMLKDAGISEKQIKELTTVNDELWELRVHDEDATAPEVSRKAKELIHKQMDILTPEQRQKVQEKMKARAMEARKQMEAQQKEQEQGAAKK